MRAGGGRQPRRNRRQWEEGLRGSGGEVGSRGQPWGQQDDPHTSRCCPLLTKGFCWVFHPSPPSLPTLGGSARKLPRSFCKSRSLQLHTAPGCPPPAPSTGFWGDQRLFTAPPPQLLLPACPIQGQDLGFLLHWTGRRLLTKPSWGISMGRNLASMPGRARRTPATPGPNILVCLRGA